ncbi:unnamed protein product, partial [Adineta ricciae]
MIRNVLLIFLLIVVFLNICSAATCHCHVISTYYESTETALIKRQLHEKINPTSRTWDEAIRLAKDFASQMTLEERCNMTAGVGGHCAGYVLPVPRLNFNGLCFQDSPSGVGDGVQFSTAFAAGIQIAAT